MSTLTRIRHTYADVKLVRENLEGSFDSGEWTADSRVLRILCEAVSDRIRGYIGQCFGPRTETHAFDWGTGRARSSAEFPGNRARSQPDYWVSSGGRLLALDEWLVSATTVTAYGDTARSSSTVLTAGTSNDYVLEPYNSNPKYLLKLSEDSNNNFSGGMQTITILGTWGWSNHSAVQAATVSGAHNTTVTSILLTDAKDISTGTTLFLNSSEQVYVTAVSGDTVTVERGANGTTAASYSGGEAVAVVEYPSEVISAALDIVRNRWHERSAGAAELIGAGDSAFSRPGSEERSILKRLDDYRAHDLGAGVVF